MRTVDRRWRLDDLPDGTRLRSWNGLTYWWVDGRLADEFGRDADWFMVLPAHYEEASPCA